MNVYLCYKICQLSHLPIMKYYCPCSILEPHGINSINHINCHITPFLCTVLLWNGITCFVMFIEYLNNIRELYLLFYNIYPYLFWQYFLFPCHSDNAFSFLAYFEYLLLQYKFCYSLINTYAYTSLAPKWLFYVHGIIKPY